MSRAVEAVCMTVLILFAMMLLHPVGWVILMILAAGWANS